MSRMLRPLSVCGLQDRPAGKPSWVRDWSRPSRRFRLPDLSTSLYSGAEFSFRECNILEVVGVEVATVKMIHASNRIASNHDSDIEDFFHEVLRMVSCENPGDASASLPIETYLRTLCCIAFSDAYYPE